MLPSITPPTDNLYKFVSLFGLTIFLFSSFNLGLVYDKTSGCKMKIEDVKVEMNRYLFENGSVSNPSMQPDSVNARFRPILLGKIDSELHYIEKSIKSAKLTPLQKIKLFGELSKMNIALDSLLSKRNFCFGFVTIGLLTMFFGFARWHKREQKLRDQMLEIEHMLKQLEGNKMAKLDK